MGEWSSSTASTLCEHPLDSLHGRISWDFHWWRRFIDPGAFPRIPLSVVPLIHHTDMEIILPHGVLLFCREVWIVGPIDSLPTSTVGRFFDVIQSPCPAELLVTPIGQT